MVKRPLVLPESISLPTINSLRKLLAKRDEARAGKNPVLPRRQKPKVAIILFSSYEVQIKKNEGRCQNILDPALASRVGSLPFHPRGDGGLGVFMPWGESTTDTPPGGLDGPSPARPLAPLLMNGHSEAWQGGARLPRPRSNLA